MTGRLVDERDRGNRLAVGVSCHANAIVVGVFTSPYHASAIVVGVFTSPYHASAIVAEMHYRIVMVPYQTKSNVAGLGGRRPNECVCAKNCMG